MLGSVTGYVMKNATLPVLLWPLSPQLFFYGRKRHRAGDAALVQCEIDVLHQDAGAFPAKRHRLVVLGELRGRIDPDGSKCWLRVCL